MPISEAMAEPWTLIAVFAALGAWLIGGRIADGGPGTVRAVPLLVVALLAVPMIVGVVMVLRLA